MLLIHNKVEPVGTYQQVDAVGSLGDGCHKGTERCVFFGDLTSAKPWPTCTRPPHFPSCIPLGGRSIFIELYDITPPTPLTQRSDDSRTTYE